MDNSTIRIKLKQRLNKLDSLDYDNIECWQMVEAFNKAQLKWVRQQLKGLNTNRQGDETSRASVDDLQRLLTRVSLESQPSGLFAETETFPDDYLAYKRIGVTAHTCACAEPRRMIVYQAQEADVDVLLSDELTKPSFVWAETFATLSSHSGRIYLEDGMMVDRIELHYYRIPTPISFNGCVDLSTGQPTPDVLCEFQDDVIEIILDETAAILAGDLENVNQVQLNQNRAQLS